MVPNPSSVRAQEGSRSSTKGRSGRGSERGSVENVNSRPSRHGSAMFVAGILLAVLGGIGISAEANNHAVCDSTLGQLAQFDQNIRDSCSTDNALFYLGIVVLVAGSVLLVVGSIRLSRPPRPAPARQGPFRVNRARVGTPHQVAPAMSGGGTAFAGRSRNTYRRCRPRLRRLLRCHPRHRCRHGHCRHLRRRRPLRQPISPIRSPGSSR